MNTRNYLGTSILALALILSGSASAFAKDVYKLTLRYDMTLKGAPLAQGEYGISWVAHSPQATVTVVGKNSVVTTVEGRVVDVGKKIALSTVLYDTNADGTRTIREIRLAGSTQVIVFD